MAEGTVAVALAESTATVILAKTAVNWEGCIVTLANSRVILADSWENCTVTLANSMVTSGNGAATWANAAAISVDSAIAPNSPMTQESCAQGALRWSPIADVRWLGW